MRRFYFRCLSLLFISLLLGASFSQAYQIGGNEGKNNLFSVVFCFLKIGRCESGINSVNGITGEVITEFVVGDNDGCSGDSNFKSPTRYLQSYLLGLKPNAVRVTPSASRTLYPLPTLDPFNNAEKLESYYTNSRLSFGAPKNLISCAFAVKNGNYPILLINGGANVFANEIDRKVAVAHYYNVMNLLRQGQLAALENVATINSYLGQTIPLIPMSMFPSNQNVFREEILNKTRYLDANVPVVNRTEIIDQTRELLDYFLSF